MNQNRQISAVVVDDEELARENLVFLLGEFPDVFIKAQCENGIEAVTTIRELKPDVVFLDIHMPQVDGFDVLDLLEEVPATIFVTAHDEYAVRAFEANAVDYLLKPVNKKRLAQSLEKLRTNLELNKLSALKFLEYQNRNKKNIDRILIRDSKNIHVIPTAEIIWLEAQDDYVAVKTINSIYLKLERLNILEEQLNSSRFKRIHRSYIVNMDFVQKIEDQKTAILKTGDRLPISRSGYSRFFRS